MLPKLRPLRFIEKHLSAERRHMAHEVRQHWRTYLSGEPCGFEQHDWEYDHDNGYRLCGKCMSYSRRIEEHVRGDASLGWVDKEYRVHKHRHVRVPASPPTPEVKTDDQA